MRDTPAARLERSCGAAPGDWMRVAPALPGLERFEAVFAGHGFDPHRHDTYALGITLGGVQAFRYRGAEQRSTAGQVVVLHPDETHDGHAGTSDGFHYRIAYVEPRLIQAALGEPARPLPYLRQPVSDDARLAAALRSALANLEQPLDALQRDAVLVEIAEALAAAAGARGPHRSTAIDQRAVQAAREFLDARAPGPATSVELERVTGLSRFTLARQFRACLGTSPHRYLTLRRLDRARARIGAGEALAEVALACGFADQSHFTRQFKQAYGLTPGRWAALESRRTRA